MRLRDNIFTRMKVLCPMPYALCPLIALCLAVSLFINSALCAEFIDKKTAVVRIMNKQAGKARTVRVPVEKKTEFEKLEILVRACKSTGPFAAQDNFMFVEIMKSSQANASQIFSGWMTASEPGDNPLQDAEYDLWLLGCE